MRSPLAEQILSENWTTGQIHYDEIMIRYYLRRRNKPKRKKGNRHRNPK